MTKPFAGSITVVLLLLKSVTAFTIPARVRALSFSYTCRDVARQPSTGRSSFFHLKAENTTILETLGEPPKNVDIQYNWKDQWYALTFASYIPNPSESAETVPAAVFGRPLVLWKSQDNGEIYCADDVCPHRSAALSEGRIRDGTIECLYHGWQFSGGNNGRCVNIPQLEPKAEIPKRACLRMRECRVVEGIVWVWMGEAPATTDPPVQGDILDPVTGSGHGLIVNDFQIDLPYDHSYLVENLIDPAHIPISHDRTPGGGKREDAQAYEMIVDEGSVNEKGFTGRFRHAASAPDGPWTELKFEAPGIIRQFGNPRANLKFGAALHCMPLSMGRSRLLFRVYIGGLPWLARVVFQLKPKAFRDLSSCKVLEQDVGLITTQEDHFSRNPDHALADDFLLLRSSDRFVGEYRKWMDRVGHGMPWFQGLAKRSSNVANHLTGTELAPGLAAASHRSSGQDNVETRYHRHVMHCPNTRKMLKRVRYLKRFSALLSVTAFTGMAALVPGRLVHNRSLSACLLVSGPIFAASFALLRHLESCFYVSFKRKNQLQTERGM